MGRMRNRLVVVVPVAGALALLLAALLFTASAEPGISGGAPDAELSLSPDEVAPASPLAPEELFLAFLADGGAAFGQDAWAIVGGDTIRYRVCKDLSICFLAFASPAIGLATPVIPLTAPSPLLTPVEVLAAAPEAPGWTPWGLLGVPLLAYPLVGRNDFTPPGGEGGGGGGAPPPEPGPGPEVPPPGGEPETPPPGPGPELPPPEPGPETPPPDPEMPPPGPGIPPPGPEAPPPGPVPPPTVVPEPASMLLIGTGLAGLALRRRHRERKRQNGG